MADQHERTSGRLLLHRLLDYIHEQAKEVDPRSYRLGAVRGFVRRSDELVGLPGVESDLKVAGDHVWLRIQRLEANTPPPVPDTQKGLFRVSKNPDGPLPELDEAALLHWLEKAGREKTPQEGVEFEAQVRAETLQSLIDYTGLWSAWAEGERPRRQTITLYADLFALKHHLEAEETAKPQEFVCGIGISYWQLQFEGSPVSFEYPLLTQAIEISLEEHTLALEVRPRATDTNVELDALPVLRQRMCELAQTRVRFGYRRLRVLMQREGWVIGKERFYRVYTEEGLALRRKRPWRHATAVHREQRRPAAGRNDIWSMDFVADELADGRKFRTLTVLDLYTRECLDITVGRGLTGHDVVATLERLRFERGLPERIYCDNGTEFVSAAMDLWAYTNKVILDFSRRGKPTDNAAIESFNGRFREECLNVHWFQSMDDATTKIESWRQDYNANHPHRALKGLSPDEYARRAILEAAGSPS